MRSLFPWRSACLPLRWRAMLWIVGLQGLVLALATGFFLADARDSVRREAADAQTTARALVLATVASLDSATDPRAALRRLPAQLLEPPQVRIRVFDSLLGELPPPPHARPAKPPGTAGSHAPRWFSAWFGGTAKLIRVPVRAAAGQIGMVGMVVIEAAPQQAVDRVWRELTGLLAIFTAALAGLLGLLWVVIGRTLAPLGRISATLGALEQGDLSARTALAHGPDLGPVSHRVNALAASLERAAEERRQLQARLTLLRDEERKHLARELHDEMGPCLFGLSVAADALERGSSGAMAKHAQDVATITQQLQRTARQVLDTLQPAIIGTLPLADAIEEAVRLAAQQFGALSIRAEIAPDLPPSSEAVDLTLFRFVQEGLTNAARHAQASTAEVRLAPAPGGIAAEVVDDGRGPQGGPQGGLQPGNGLLGMRDRIDALGGRLEIGAGPQGGLRLAAFVPCGEKENDHAKRAGD